MSDKLIVNCETGEVTEESFTADEKKQRTADKAETNKRVKAEQDAQAKREADIEKVKAKAANDADFAALARLIGVDI